MAEQKLTGFLEKRLPKITLILGILGIVGAGLFGQGDPKQFFFSYLFSYIFFLTISLGAMFFVIIQHLTRAGWSVVLRRIPELLMQNIVVMAVLFVPVLLGLHELYEWSDLSHVAEDALLRWKRPFLNSPFFLIRCAVYFASWILLARFFFKSSVKQDESGDKGLTLSMQKGSAVAVLIFAITVTFASVDWVMSLTPHWFSTMIGVYIFAGSMVVSLSVISLLALVLKRFGFLGDKIRIDHYHDLGKLIFGFVVFWAYISFCQYFLIWYGNIPEETEWYLHHISGNWEPFIIAIIFGHFVLPFFLFISRHAKRNLPLHLAVVLLLITMHAFEMYWLIMPNLHHHGIHFSVIDLLCFVGIFGFYTSYLFFNMSKYSLYPVKDPRLPESESFKNY